MRRTVLLAAVATMIVLAGCAGAGPGTESAAPTDDSSVDGDEPTDGAGTDGDQSGTVSFYLSDDPNDIDDFRHLNVTVTEVQFRYAGNDSDDGTTVTVTPEPTATDTPDETATEAQDETATETPGETTTEMTAEATAVLTATTTPGMAAASQDDDDETAEDDANEERDEEADEEREGEGDEERGEESDSETDEESDAEMDDESKEDDQSGESRWITREVNGTSIDLTELQGANASLLEHFSVPAGEYTQVRLVVSDIDATLTDGSDQRVKLPSERLKLNTPFTLGPDSSVDFVFDITVHEAGNSGKYILKPVASESGTDQEIERVDAGPPEERGPEREEDEQRGDGEQRGNGNGGQQGNSSAD